MQNFEVKNERIREQFKSLKKRSPESFNRRLNLSWSNWGFGMESLCDSAKRLEQAGVSYVELHGNHYGPDLGYCLHEAVGILGDHGLKVSGVCGMFSADNDLSSNRAIHRQAAIGYLQREVPFTEAVGGSYLLVVPAAVGRATAYDAMEFDRSVQTLRVCADLFTKHHVKAAIEPIRAAETSLVHSVADAQRYIAEVNHPGVKQINADVYHMQSEESHIGEALLACGDMLANVHLADSNRGALGAGSLDVATIIRALYILGFNSGEKFVTFEPLGPGGDPYPAMYGKPDKPKLDALVMDSVNYFRACEESILSE